MKEYMVEFTIIADPKSKDFQDLLPAEQQRTKELLNSGEIRHMWLKEDKSGGYFVAFTNNEKEVQEINDSLPLKKYLAFKTYALNMN
ncbi:muconolactone Delta-isomerase family protein [Arcobacter sp.]|uniref:muconolactone Delta-isomerase family protein n=1 Tax=unclassified Arcobacter TaxID=2593671 RepID=UPI003B0017A0